MSVTNNLERANDLARLYRELQWVEPRAQQEKVIRVRTETATLVNEMRYIVRAALREGVPVGDLRAAVGAGKNWRTWQKFRREIGLTEED